MIEILWHGRGGQGAFTAARLLGAAASMGDEAYALAFPSFGPERRGAPMRAFTKVSDAPIGDRSAIERADYVVYLDDTLLGADWDRELKPGGIALVNSVQTFEDPRIVSIDANGISTRYLGRPIPNTVFLGALSELCDRIDPACVIEAIHHYMPKKLHEKNEQVVEAARSFTMKLREEGCLGVACSCAGETTGNGADACEPEAGSLPVSATVEAEERTLAALADRDAQLFNAQTGAQKPSPLPYASGKADADRARCAHIPVLREGFEDAPSLDPAVFAHSTMYPAGHLVAVNAGWRNVRPVIDAQKCTGCLQCYLYCPDGTVFKEKGGEGSAAVAIDLDFCKGCGICAKVCKFDAIEMVAESEVNAR